MKVRSEFAYHRLNAKGQAAATEIAESFSTFLDHLERVVGSNGREMALVRTKLEEASFFAKKAVSINLDFQEDAP